MVSQVLSAEDLRRAVEAMEKAPPIAWQIRLAVGETAEFLKAMNVLPNTAQVMTMAATFHGVHMIEWPGVPSGCVETHMSDQTVKQSQWRKQHLTTSAMEASGED